DHRIALGPQMIVGADHGQRGEVGHQVSVARLTSGVSVGRREGDGWIGGADPRREGEVLGDTR
ncbi:hypothetical protein, partial [Nocardia cyriacigeorgica]|uniref:hypothetical protein n=1 Tax=Nocardia cyriacigeorgica TaxID=135487 RepID=UPI0024554A9A